MVKHPLNVEYIMHILVTPLAKEHIIKFVPTGYAGIRIALVPNGCAGWEHVFTLCEEPDDGDLMLSLTDNIVMVVAPNTHLFLDGAELDYVCTGVNYELQLNNPNVTVCGCGKSFSNN